MSGSTGGGAFPYTIPVSGGSPISIDPSLLSSSFTSATFPTNSFSISPDTGVASSTPVSSFAQTPYGSQYANGIPQAFTQGLDLSTQIGVDTLAARISGNNPNALPFDPGLANDTTSINTPLLGYLGIGGVNSNEYVATPGSSAYTTNSAGYADPTSSTLAAINQQLNVENAPPEINPMLALAFPTLVGGGIAAASALGLGGLGGAGVADLGDVATSDLGAITAGAGDIGGAVPVAGGAAIGDTLGSLSAFDAGGGLTDPTAVAQAIGAGGASPLNASIGVAPTTNDITLAASTAQPAAGAAPALDPTAAATDLSATDPFAGNTLATAPTTTATVPTGPASFQGLGSSLIDQAGVSPGGGIVGDVLGPTTTGTGAAGGSAASGGGGIVNSIGQFVGSPTGKLIGAGISAASLGADILKKNDIPGLSNIQQLAQSSATQGQVLQTYLQNGTLPPAIQTSIDAATRDGITAIKAKYAQMGVSGSSAEAEDIQRLQQNAVIQGATLADQLLQQGISETQLSGQLYAELVSANTALNTQTGQAIGALASALAGGGTTLRLAA